MNRVFIPSALRKLLFFLIIVLTTISFSFGQNPIIDENQLAGTPQSAWDALDGGTIEGFAQEFSVNKGETVHFKIDIFSAPTPVPFTVKIYRIGWYQGNGARFITDLGNSLMGQTQPASTLDPVTGKVDCNNWAVSASWTVPTSATSGVYIARLDCPSNGGSTIMVFVVRDDAANAPMLFKTSDATWQAYNNYGGNSFYNAATPVPGFSHATKVSYQRPVHLRGDKSSFFNAEYPMIRWLEKNGYNITYSTDMDMARDNSIITPSVHKVILSVGHDEYWSAEQRTKFENARANGVNVAFFSGNEIYWKTRWEDNYQTLVCYKEGTKGENICGSKCDPMPNVWTGLWRDGCDPAYGPNDGCRPEGSFSGQMSWTQSNGSIKIPDTYKNLRFWKNTSIASLGTGQTAVMPLGTLGNEWDPEQYAETYPAHRIVLSNTLQAGLTHKMSLYRYSSGALIFSAGAMNWAWGLDDKHDNGSLTPSADMQQATVNLLHDMGVEAQSLQNDLVVPTIGADALAPSTTIVSPIHNSTVAGGSITITGTSVDNGPSAIAGVEVSVDNGATWQIATGLENWTYTFSPTGYGTITIKVRAWDDLGNVEVPGSPGSPNCITIALSGPFNHSVFNATYPTTPPTLFGGGSVELGMKFQSTIPGYINGFRYYKGPGVTGVHIGHLWDNTGTLLATETFTNETPTGWQSVSLTTPVAIAANTTYIVSYFTTTGEFTRTDPFFTQPIVNGFLKGLANGDDGFNGIYAYTATPGVFPQDNTGSSNYFADVIFASADVTAPQVLSITPANNSTGIALNIHPTATFDETLDPGTVTTSTVILTGPGNVTVPGVASVSGSVITFTPNTDLAIGTAYTLTLKGGLNEPLIKDLSGNALGADYSWTFTTGGLASPVVTTQPVSQITCANSSISFTSAATGIPTPTVQWQVSLDNGGTWTNIGGATAGTYTFTAATADNNNQYRAVWTNSQASVNSDPATLTVASTITGSIAAVNANICPGSPMQLQLSTATGPSPYTLVINSNTYSGVTVGQPFQPVQASESIWNLADEPQELIVPDNLSIEVGVKFQANKNGVIKGIRFYKGSTANGGTHVGSLWSQSGTLLASATFTNETASGWQEVLFTTPVDVTANTTYVASYFLPQGNYSRDGSYFSVSHSNGNSLTALQNTGAEPNGVYVYTSQSSTFPILNPGDPNYWVDVVFAPYTTTTTTFNLTSITAANGCSLSGNPLSSATITVSATVNAGTVSGPTPLCIGATATYTTNGDPGGSWSSTNTAVATVNPATGLVTAVGAGTTDITYTVTGCNGTASNFQTLTVSPNANAGTVSGTSPLCIGATATYTSNGDAGGSWASSNTAVATVNPTTGLVTALSAGTTTIQYTVGCNAVSSAILTVNPNANVGTVSGTSPLCIGATTTYTSNGDAGGSWASSNTAVATVNPATGLVTAIGSGLTTISYTIAGCNGTASASLTVSTNASAGTVSGPSMCIGSTATYTSNGDAGGSWSSSNTTVATVNPTTGEVTALTAGTSNITYTVNAGCNNPASSFAILTVNPNANAGTVNGTSPLCIGSTATYTSNGDAGGSWSSSNTSIATVNPTTGLVTAVGSGTASIIYTVGCNAVSSANLTVSLNANAGTVTGAPELCIGATTTYGSNGDAGGSWSSSNTSVATVNPGTGLVTAISAGTSNIIYTVSTGCNNPVSSSALLTVAVQVSGTIAAVNANICPGSPMQLQLPAATGPSPYTLTINSNTYPGITVGQPFRPFGASETIWTNADDEPLELVHVDNLSIEVGVKFQSNKDGVIRGIRFYKGSTANGGTHIGSLWTQSGTLLASATFTNETASGWQEVLFAAPVAVTANTTYVASYFLPQGNYSKDGTYFSTSHSNGNSLTALQNTVGEPNAVYAYSGQSTFPDQNFGDPNYWVDVVFAAYTTTTTTFNLTNITAANGCSLSGNPINSVTITVSATVNAGTVAGLSPLCIGGTATYTSNGDPGGVWSSTNTAVATVNPTTGLVTAVGAGSADITYTVTGCNGTASNFQAITVAPNADPGTVSGTSPLCIGATATYTSNGEAGGVWSSTNTSVATVNPTTGFVTAIAAGTTDIKYTLNVGCNSPLSSFKTLTVSPDANAGTISGPSSLCTTTTFTYTSNGDAGGTWNSSDPLVATINPTTGLVTALLVGTTNITYTINTGCSVPVTSAPLALTVNLIPDAGTVSGTSPLCIGATDTYTSSGTGGGTWSSTNPLVATVNPTTGLVTAIAAGTTDITYSLSGCVLPVSSFKTLTVNNCINTVNLKLYLRGYYMSAGQMQPVLLNQGIGASNTDVDNITVELHNATAPYAIVASTTGMLKTNGNCTVSFPASFNGSYYIAIKHRNTIQTWTTLPLAMSATVNYDFTTAANKAYGDNMADLGDGRWAFFTGDINQDENIDLLDYPDLDFDINNFSSGFFSTDLNGDGNVDLIDYPIWDANNANFISSVHP